MNVVFGMPNMVIGGVESVFIRTLDGMLKSISDDPVYKDTKISVITHAKITEPVYANWFKKHKEIKVYVCYPLQNWFERVKEYTEFFPLRQLRKLIFGLYKKLSLLKVKRYFRGIDVFIDYKNCSFFKELRFCDAKKITWVHGSVKYLVDSGICNRLALYDKIVGLTDDFVIEFKKTFPSLERKVLRIYNPIDKELIENAAKGAPKPYGKYFCSVSRLENHQKDLDTLIVAFNKFYLRNKKPDVKLMIVGGGPQEKKLKKLADSLGCDKAVVFAGVQNNPFGYMKNAMCVILSSKLEGLPTVLIEAMALNTLCVSSDCQYGPKEILLDGEAGILFRTGNAEQLAAIMTDVYSKRTDTTAMIEKASKSLTRFSPKLITKQIMDLIWA